MRISLLKKINERTPYWIKKPFSKIIRDRLINNKEFKTTYSNLIKYDSMNKDQISKIQLGMLRDTLIHAYEHTGYYHRIFDEAGIDVYKECSYDAFNQIPLLTKEDLKSHLGEMLADDIDDSYLVTTGGTTGEPTRVQMERNAIYREWAFVYHYWSKFGYDYKSSKLATLRGVDLGKKLYEINPLYAEVRLNSFALNDRTIEQYIKIIDDYGAEFIYGYPSTVYNFCRLAEKYNIDMKGKFKATFLISENLYPFQEELIKRVLNCDIAMFYGHSERAVFAEKYGQYYTFNEMYGVTELSENNEPIVTGFINAKTPLIRYVVDDQIEVHESGGVDITGHWGGEELIGINGERITTASINFHDDTFKHIKAYQFVQDEAGKCFVKLEADNKLEESEIVNINKRIAKKLGDGFEVEVKQVKKIETTSRGKYKMLISNISGGVLSRYDRCSIIGHRDSDIIYGINGEQFRATMLDFHGQLTQEYDFVQFEQNEKGKCIVRLCSDSKANADASFLIEKELNRFVNGCINFEIHNNEMPIYTKRGKYKMFIQNSKNDNTGE